MIDGLTDDTEKLAMLLKLEVKGANPHKVTHNPISKPWVHILRIWSLCVMVCARGMVLGLALFTATNTTYAYYYY